MLLAWAVAVELERIGAFDRAFIDQHVLGAEEFMGCARAWPPERAAEACGVDAEDIRRFARWYHEAQPATIAWGNGLERNQNGGSGVRAIAALPALAGKFGVPGGGLVAGAGHAYPTDYDRLTRPDLVPAGTRTFNILDVARLLLDPALDPPLKALFIYNHNPLIVHPDQNRMRQALARYDLFIAGCDVAMTDSMAYADIILPASTHFEHGDLYAAYGQQYLQRVSRSSRRSARACRTPRSSGGWRRASASTTRCSRPTTHSSWTTRSIDDDPRMAGQKPSKLPLDRALSMEYDGAEPVLFRNVWPKTPSGKIELRSSLLDERYAASLPTFRPVESRYPLALISPASDKRITSTFGGLAVNDAAPVLEMNPADAAARNLEDGSWVRVFNDLGEVFLPLKVTTAVRPGVVCSEKGAWLRTSPNRQTISALAPTHKADIAEGACFNDARVEVAAAPSAGSPNRS